MDEYTKIQTVFLRDASTNHKTLLEGQYTLPEFEYLAELPWEWTEKVNGTNIRIMWDTERVRFGGREKDAQLNANLVNTLMEMFTAERFKSAGLADPICLYGEGYGPNIAKGSGNYRGDPSFVLFDVKVDKWWLRRADLNDVAAKLGIDAVPVVGTGTLPELVEFVRNGFKSQWGDFDAEGIVARPAVPLCGRNGERLITKLKHRDFPEAA